MGIRIQAVMVLAVAVVAGLVWYGEFWFDRTFGEPSQGEFYVTVTPTGISSQDWLNQLPGVTRGVPTMPPASGTGPSDSLSPTPTSVLPTTVPTITPTPPPLPTTTPLPQTVQVTASFIKYALCPSDQSTAAQSVIEQTEDQLALIQAEYDECKAQADAETQACVDTCVDLGCLLNCESEAEPKFQACEDVYHAAYDPVVDAAVDELNQLCSTVVR